MLGGITKRGLSRVLPVSSSDSLLEEQNQCGLEDLDCGLRFSLTVLQDQEDVWSHISVEELQLLQFGHRE